MSEGACSCSAAGACCHGFTIVVRLLSRTGAVGLSSKKNLRFFITSNL